MPNCKDCGKPLQEDFNVCPYCGFPTDKILEELEKFPEPTQNAEELEKELTSVCANASQLMQGMENPKQEQANREENGELAMPLPAVDGKEFGAPQSGPLQREEKEYLAARAKERKEQQGEGKELSDKEELKAFFTRRNVMMLMLGVIVIICVVIIIFFGNVMEPGTQMELGDDYAAAGQLEKAEKAYTNVLKQEENNVDALQKLAEVKIELNSGYKKNHEIIKLLDRLEKLTTDEAEIKNLDYQRIQLYTELGEKEKAEELLKKYIEKPMFSLESGTYSEDTLFEITAQTGAVYYTIDKEKTPQEYTGPIMLKPGSRQIKAWVVDQGGVSGNKAEAFYFITAKDSQGAEGISGENTAAKSAEKYLNDTLWKNPLPEFSSPERLTFDKLAEDVFLNVVKTRQQEPDLKSLGVPQEDAFNGEVVVTAQELEAMSQKYFGKDFKINHRSYKAWEYNEKYKLYHQPIGDWNTTPMVYVQSVQEDTDEAGNPVLTAQIVMCAFAPGPGVYHPVTMEKVFDESWDIPEEQMRKQVIENAQKFQMASVSLKQNSDGSFIYQSCQYTN